MSFFKSKQVQKVETQILFKNIPAERKFNQFKKYFGIVEIGGKDHLYTPDVPLKFRNEATEYFEDATRLDGGKLKSVGVFK